MVIYWLGHSVPIKSSTVKQVCYYIMLGMIENASPKPNCLLTILKSKIHLNTYMSLDNMVRIVNSVCIKKVAYFPIIRSSYAICLIL